MTAGVTAKIISSVIFGFYFYYKIASALVWVELKIFHPHPFLGCILLFSREGAEDRLYATDRSGVGPEEGSLLQALSKRMRQCDIIVGTGSLLGGTGWAAKKLDSSMWRESLNLRLVTGSPLHTLN